jgi:hypothetical protein
MANIAITGFGRIGDAAFGIILDTPEFAGRVTALLDLNPDKVDRLRQIPKGYARKQ